MKLQYLLFSLLFILFETGCQKSFPSIQDGLTRQATIPLKSSTDYNILIDASKDGGSWWYPQSAQTGFSEAKNHGGKAFADYLRKLGFQVDELPRGAVITNQMLQNYSKIIRSPAFFNYADSEIAAYKSFLSKPGALMLLQDHLAYSTNDKLSELLGLHFDGAVAGMITDFAPNEITNGVTELLYNAGAVVTNSENNPNITVLGTLDKNNYTAIKNSYPFNGNIDAPVMGILNNYPNTKIFFLGDENGLESLPQPFTQNVVNWLFK